MTDCRYLLAIFFSFFYFYSLHFVLVGIWVCLRCSFLRVLRFNWCIDCTAANFDHFHWSSCSSLIQFLCLHFWWGFGGFQFSKRFTIFNSKAAWGRSFSTVIPFCFELVTSNWKTWNFGGLVCVWKKGGHPEIFCGDGRGWDSPFVCKWSLFSFFCCTTLFLTSSD